MQSLILNLEAKLVERAQRYASARGKPLDELVAQYFAGLEAPPEVLEPDPDDLAQRAALRESLRGLLGGREAVAPGLGMAGGQ